MLTAKLDAQKQATTPHARRKPVQSRHTTQAGAAVVEASNAIAQLKLEYDAAGRKTEEYRAKMSALVQTDARTALIDLALADRSQHRSRSGGERADKGRSSVQPQHASSGRSRRSVARTRERGFCRSQRRRRYCVVTEDVATAEGTLVSAFNAAGSRRSSVRLLSTNSQSPDRLLAIQERTMTEMLARGQLSAEEAALRDAAAATQEYGRAQRPQPQPSRRQQTTRRSGSARPKRSLMQPTRRSSSAPRLSVTATAMRAYCC